MKKPSGARLGLFLVAVLGILVLIGFAVNKRAPSDQPPIPSAPRPAHITPTSATTLSTRTLIRSVPAGRVYAYENAAGETVEEMETWQGRLISRWFYRPALPACAYLRSVSLATDRY